MSKVTETEIAQVLKHLPGPSECIEDPDLAVAMKRELHKAIGDMGRYIEFVEALQPRIRGYTMDWLLVAPVVHSVFCYLVSDEHVTKLLLIMQRNEIEHPESCYKLRQAILVYRQGQRFGTGVYEKGAYTNDGAKNEAIAYFRMHPEYLRYSMSGLDSAPVYHTSANMINIANTMGFHDMRLKGDTTQTEAIIAVGPMSRALYDIMNVPMNFPRDGYAPVLDLDAKLLLLAPVKLMLFRYEKIFRLQQEGRPVPYDY